MSENYEIGQMFPKGRDYFLKSGFLIDSMKSGGDVSGMSPIWPKLGQLTRFGLKTIVKPIFLSFITVKVDLELKNCENVKKFQKRFGP